MGRKVLIGISIVVGLIVLALFALGIASHYMTPDSGLVDGKLRACPAKPNCICSETYADREAIHAIAPIKVAGGDIDALWQLLRDAVVESGGEVVEEGSGYLHAEFTSTVFRFIDDLELRLDRDRHEIHIRSASRVGRSDLGANRKRVEQIWRHLGTGHTGTSHMGGTA